MKKCSIFFTFIFIISLNCSSRAIDTSVNIDGSDTMVNLVQAWAEEFVREKPDYYTAVTGGGSGTGIASLLNKTCNIAMCSRKIKPQEIDLARRSGIEAIQHIMALDGIAVIVHPSNPVNTITIQQLKDIFTCKVTNWQEVGGNDTKIIPLSREVNSGTYVYFKKKVLNKEEFHSSILLMPSSQTIADEVRNNKYAIGYFGMGYINDTVKVLKVAKDEKSRAYAPTDENVISGKYPIARPLFFYTPGEPTGVVKEFIDFAHSKKGREIVKKQGFVPLNR